jgi:DNA-binding NarL/FixJ family response regulator
MSQPVRIALVDDHLKFLQTMEIIFRSVPEVNLLFTANSGRTFFEIIEDKSNIPDVLLLDIQMPGMDGIEVLKKLKTQPEWSKIKVIIFSNWPSEINIKRSLHHGAYSVIDKSSSDMEELKNAIIDIHTSDANPNLKKKKTDKEHDHHLPTEREVEFLIRCCSDDLYKEIAMAMHISEDTVENHRASLFKKLNVKTRAGLIRYAYSQGILGVYFDNQE